MIVDSAIVGLASPAVEHRGWEWVQAVQAGDGYAFGALYRHYAPQLYEYCLRRLGDRTAAEDCVSETFVRALERIDTLTYRGRDVGAWLRTIARNIVIDGIRSGRSRYEVLTDVFADRHEPGHAPEHEALLALDRYVVLRGIAALGGDQRRCLVLRFLCDRDVSEVAQLMDRTPAAVKALQYRALRALAGLTRAYLREAG